MVLTLFLRKIVGAGVIERRTDTVYAIPELESFRHKRKVDGRVCKYYYSGPHARSWFVWRYDFLTNTLIRTKK